MRYSLISRAAALLVLGIGSYLANAGAEQPKQDRENPAPGDQRQGSPNVWTVPLSDKPFIWEDGSLKDLLEKLREVFGVDLERLATIEVSKLTRVPKFRVSRPSLGNVFGTYNELSKSGFEQIGQWKWGPMALERQPDILTLTSPVPQEPPMKLRAFSLRGLQKDDRAMLIESVSNAADELRATREQFGLSNELAQVQGRLRFNENTELLLVIGSVGYIEVAEEIVNEFRARSVESSFK